MTLVPCPHCRTRVIATDGTLTVHSWGEPADFGGVPCRGSGTAVQR